MQKSLCHRSVREGGRQNRYMGCQTVVRPPKAARRWWRRRSEQSDSDFRLRMSWTWTGRLTGDSSQLDWAELGRRGVDSREPVHEDLRKRVHAEVT